MTKSETKKLQDIHLKLWKKLKDEQKARRICFGDECEDSPLIVRYRTEWCAVDDVLEALNVKIEYTDPAWWSYD